MTETPGPHSRSGAKPATLGYFVAVEHYKVASEERRREGLSEQTAALASVLARAEDVRWASQRLANGGTSRKISRKLSKGLGNATESDRLILYWTGHGKSEGDGLYLLTYDSPAKGFNSLNSMPARELASWVANSPAEKILVVLDTCYSGQGAAEIADALNKISVSTTSRRGRQRCVHVIATAHAYDPRTSGVVSECLHDLLDAESSPERRWGDNDRFIRCDDLTQALDDMLLDRDVGSQLVPKRDGWGDEFIPNPRYFGALPPLDIETKRRFLHLEPHFIYAASGSEVDVARWYFTGRRDLLDDLSAWVAVSEPGLRIVTGPPGAGKSAVIGRLVALVHVGYQDLAQKAGAQSADLRPLAIEPVVLHARGRGRAELMAEIADQLGLPDAVRQTDDITVFLTALEQKDNPAVIIVDAVDEAVESDRAAIASELIVGLARRAGYRVLVGCRRRLDGATPHADEDRHRQLNDFFDHPDITDLADETKTFVDLVDYVTARLSEAGSPHAGHPRLGAVAKAVATRADGSFLYARLVARSLRDRKELDPVRLPATAKEALRYDLQSRTSPEDADRGEAMLAALAWARGAGLTRAVWPDFAQAVSRSVRTFGQPDVAWALDHLGWHIVETAEEGQTAYRLAHQTFDDDFQANVAKQDVETRLVQRLTDGVSSDGWARTDRYLWRHLADHAAAAGTLMELVDEPGYLGVANPPRLAAALYRIGLEDGPSPLGNLYLRTWQWLDHQPPADRRAVLHLAALQEIDGTGRASLCRRLEPGDESVWRARWAAWRPSADHEVVQKHRRPIRSLAVRDRSAPGVIVTAALDGTVTTVDLETHRRTVVFEGPMGATKVAIGQLGGRDVIVTGDTHNTVHLLALDGSSERTYEGHKGPAGGSLPVAVGQWQGHPVIVSGGRDATVRVWDPAGGDPVILEGHTNNLTSLAIGTIGGTEVIASASEDETVRIWSSLRPSDPVVLEGHTGKVCSVAIGTVGGDDVIVSGGRDGSVKVWDPASRRVAHQLVHLGDVLAVDVGLVSLSTADLIAVGLGYPGGVLIWNPMESTEPHILPGHTNAVWTVRLTRTGDRVEILSGSDDGTVRRWTPPLGSDTFGTSPVPAAPDVSTKAAGPPTATETILTNSAAGVVRWHSHNETEPVVVSSPDGRLLTVGRLRGREVGLVTSGNGTVQVVDLGDEDLSWSFETGRSIHALAVGRVDGAETIVIGTVENTIELWDPTRPNGPVRTLRGHTDSIKMLEVHEIDGLVTIVSASYDCSVRLWSTAESSARPFKTLKGVTYEDEPVVVGWRADRPVVAIGRFTGALVVHHLADEREPLLMEGHEQDITAVTFGRVSGHEAIITGSIDQTVRIWLHATGACHAVIPVLAPVRSLAQLRDGSLAVGTTKGLVVLELQQ